MKFKKETYSYIMMLGHMCADMCGGALPAILPFLIVQRGISYTAAAGLTFALSGISSVIQPLFGYFADKAIRPWIMAAGIICSGLCMGALGFLNSYAAMFVAVMFTGIFTAIFHPDGGKMANYVSGEHKGKSMSIFSVGGNLGGAIGPALAVMGIKIFGLKGTAVLMVPTILMGAFFLSQNGSFKAIASEAEEQVKTSAKSGGSVDDWRGFSRLTAVVFLRSAVSTGVNTFIPLIYVSILLQSEAFSSSMTTVIALAGAVATYLGGLAADKVGFTKVIRFALILLCPFLIVITLSRSVILSTIIVVPMAMCLFGAYSPCVALGQKFIPNHIGLASGITMGLASSFGGIISPILGKIGDTSGLITVMWILVAISAMALMASFTVPVDKGEDAA